ncbi:MAG: UDP-2,3-diacylglucosamine diphosphatase, partial [Pseudomonadota bacterium]
RCMPRSRHLFVSDLHLDATAPDAVAQFCQFLQGEARSAASLYILGDMFETWIGDDDDESARAEVCTALRALTCAGIPCFVQRGNRDFLLGRKFEQRTGCKLLPDPALLQVGQVRAVISHGDMLCSADRAYQEFRSLARSPWFHDDFLRLPMTTRRTLASVARASSREHTRQLRNEIMDVESAAVEAMLRCSGSSLLIHGHTHRPGIHDLRVDGRPATRIVLGDWYDQGSCLALYSDATWELLTLPRVEFANPIMLPAIPPANPSESGTGNPVSR